ncbi:MAG: hypothetical protein EA398_16215 [Deltaproteobacteria bacterium]|nr:MAG: hypothetical protein EA398_16215 [Deltaproteobacteria bacterium]
MSDGEEGTVERLTIGGRDREAGDYGVRLRDAAGGDVYAPGYVERLVDRTMELLDRAFFSGHEPRQCDGDPGAPGQHEEDLDAAKLQQLIEEFPRVPERVRRIRDARKVYVHNFDVDEVIVIDAPFLGTVTVLCPESARGQLEELIEDIRKGAM